MKTVTTTDRTRIFEIFAVILTGIGKFVFMDWLQLKFVFIVGACLFWIGYLIYRIRKNKEILGHWGLTVDNFRKTLLELLPIAVLLVIAFVLVGNYLGTNVLDWTIVPILLLYPIWGILQQFIVIGILASNLKEYNSSRLPEIAVILIVATVFGIVHYPHLLLIGATFLLALVYTKLFLRNRNLIVLGMYHGWLGAFFYYTVLGRNTWNEVLGGLVG